MENDIFDDLLKWKNIDPRCEADTFLIQGKMILTQITISEMEKLNFPNEQEFKSQVKRQLMEKLMREMFSNKMIEFTQITDQLTGMSRYNARIYVVPDTMVRILREKGY